MSTTTDVAEPTTATTTATQTPPPTEVEIVAAGADDRLDEIDPWEGFNEEDRERG